MRALEVRGLSCAYDRSLVFSGVDLDLEEGSITAILGPNGCGKTTLLRSLAGLLRPGTGSIRIRGTEERSSLGEWIELGTMAMGERASRIGFVPQDVEATFGYTALQMVLMGRSGRLGIFGVPDQTDETLARQELEHLGIAHLGERSLHSMSGGERRLVLIARALVTEAKILLLDEPTAHLDFRNQLLVHRILDELTAKRGITVAFSTHLPTDAFGTASHALLMSRENTHTFGPIEEVVTTESLLHAFRVHARIIEVPINGKPNHVVVPERPV
ncbi:MAG: ABC transporter ATP-binding protein [Alkalispirochaetaceae bacterium]